MNEFGTMLLILIAGAFIAFVARLRATSESETAREQAQLNRNANERDLDSAVNGLGIKADAAFSTECASAAIDDTELKLALVSNKLPDKKVVIDIANIKMIRLDDRTLDYKYYQKLSRVYTGAERYTGISRKDAKYGYERLGELAGSPILSIRFILKEGDSITVPFMLGDGTAYWNKEDDYNTVKSLVSNLERRINAVNREEAQNTAV